MGTVMTSYRPTHAAIVRHDESRGSLLPREIHVHADGRTVALYLRRGDVHYASLFGVLDAHGLGTADLEPCE
jgi:hypothetical protein